MSSVSAYFLKFWYFLVRFVWSQADIVSPKAEGMLVTLQKCYILLYPHSSAPPQRPKHILATLTVSGKFLYFWRCSLQPATQHHNLNRATNLQSYNKVMAANPWHFLSWPKGSVVVFYQVFSFLFQLISQAKPSSCLKPDPTPPQLVCSYITTAKGQMSCS